MKVGRFDPDNCEEWKGLPGVYELRYEDHTPIYPGETKCQSDNPLSVRISQHLSETNPSKAGRKFFAAQARGEKPYIQIVYSEPQISLDHCPDEFNAQLHRIEVVEEMFIDDSWKINENDKLNATFLSAEARKRQRDGARAVRHLTSAAKKRDWENPAHRERHSAICERIDLKKRLSGVLPRTGGVKFWEVEYAAALDAGEIAFLESRYGVGNNPQNGMNYKDLGMKYFPSSTDPTASAMARLSYIMKKLRYHLGVGPPKVNIQKVRRDAGLCARCGKVKSKKRHCNKCSAATRAYQNERNRKKRDQEKAQNPIRN